MIPSSATFFAAMASVCPDFAVRDLRACGRMRAPAGKLGQDDIAKDRLPLIGESALVSAERRPPRSGCLPKNTISVSAFGSRCPAATRLLTAARSAIFRVSSNSCSKLSHSKRFARALARLHGSAAPVLRLHAGSDGSATQDALVGRRLADDSSASGCDQRAFRVGADDAIGGKPFTLLKAANGAPRRRIRDSVDRQLQSEHVVQRALHPAHILRAGRRGFDGIWLGHDAVRLWHDLGPKASAPRPRGKRDGARRLCRTSWAELRRPSRRRNAGPRLAEI